MKEMILLILVLILIPIIGSCQSSEDLVKETPKTGDIMVVAHGCTAPPYEFGLKLVLNKMPENREPVIKIPIPDSLKGTDRYYHIANDTIIKLHGDLLNFDMDTADGCILLKQYIYYYDDHRYSEGITDSLGHYIFSGVPIGSYQLVLSETLSFDKGVATSNSKYADRTDFPEYHPYHPKVIKDFIRDTTGVRENVNRSDYVSISNIVCKARVINEIQVKIDSISIVQIAQVIFDTKSMTILKAKQWEKEFRERGN